MPPTPVLYISAALLTAAGMLGGLPAGLLCAIALVAQCTSNCRAGGWGLIGGSLSWLVLAQVTHNRELFFPYTMLLAAVACVQLCGQRLWAGSLAGGTVLAAFFFAEDSAEGDRQSAAGGVNRGGGDPRGGDRGLQPEPAHGVYPRRNRGGRIPAGLPEPLLIATRGKSYP